MSLFKKICLCAVLVLAIVGACADVSGAPRAQYVIVISVDGLGGTYLKKIFDGTATGGSFAIPNFTRLKNEGASTLTAHCDNDNWETLPNHTSILTGRPRDSSPGFDGHNWASNSDPTNVINTIHNNKGSYVASVFDVAHDNGLRTGMYANKTKFMLFDTYGSYTNGGSYNAVHGAVDTNGADNGRHKMDNTYINTALGGAIVDTFTNQQRSASSNHYAFLHINEPDAYGHGSGWGSSNWNSCVVTVDGMIGKIFKLIEQDVPAMSNKTAIILTADHGNQDTPLTGADRYSVPFFVWGPGVSAGMDLYALNASRRQAATNYPMTTYSNTPDLQPIRNAEANNLALFLLGLGAIPGSTFNSSQELAVSVPGTITNVPYSGTDLLSLHTDAGPHSEGWSAGMTNNGGVTYKLWGGDDHVPAILDGVFDNKKWRPGANLDANDPASTAQMDANDPDKIGSGKWVWCSAHFDYPTVISNFVYRNADSANNTTPDQFQLRGSNDGTNWTVIFRFNNNGGITPWGTPGSISAATAVRFDGGGIDFPTPAAYTQVRLEVFSATQNGDALGVTEWQLAGTTLPYGEIDVTGPADTSIPDGNSDYTFAGTHFGTVAVGSSVTNTFKINNTGNGDLTLSGTPSIFVDGDFSVTTLPASPVTNGGMTTFSVTFTPTLPAGNKTTMLSITNDDANENPYNFGLKGTAATNTLQPEIDVTGPLGNSITNGNSNYTGDGTDFGAVAVGLSKTNIYAIHNTGTGSLLLCGAPMVLIGGSDAAQFIVTNQPSSDVATNGVTSFKVVFKPVGFSGTRTATVSIDNNDSNENPYTFNLRGYASGFSTGTVITVPYSGPDLLSLHTDPGPHTPESYGPDGMTDNCGVTYKVWGGNEHVPVILDGAFDYKKWRPGADLDHNDPAVTAQMDANDPGVVGSTNWVWCTAHFITPVVISRFVCRNADSPNNTTPDQFQLRGSSDGTNWTVIYRFDNNGGTTPWGVPGDVRDSTAVRFDGGGIDFPTPAAYSQIRLEVFSATGNGDAVGITEWQLAGTAPPDINNEPGATDIKLTSALLNGTLLSSFGSPAQVWAYWGIKDGSNNVVNWAHTNYFGTNTAPFPVTNSLLVELPHVPNQTYYYQYRASNDAGVSWATPSVSFRIEGGTVLIIR